jgi:hypothetical protein
LSNRERRRALSGRDQWFALITIVIISAAAGAIALLAGVPMDDEFGEERPRPIPVIILFRDKAAFQLQCQRASHSHLFFLSLFLNFFSAGRSALSLAPRLIPFQRRTFCVRLSSDRTTDLAICFLRLLPGFESQGLWN